MSKEDVAIVEAGFAVWNSGDMAAWRERLHPEVIVRPPPRWPEPGPFVGRDAVMAEFLLMRETLDADVVNPIDDFVDLGRRVVVRVAWRGRTRGPTSILQASVVYAVRDGKLATMDFFWDHAEALEAARRAD